MSAYMLDDFRDGIRIREIDAEVVGCATGSLHSLNRAQRSLRALERSELLFHQRRGRTLPSRLNAREQVALQIVFVVGEARDVRIVGIRLRYEIEQIECSARSSSQVRGDG